MNAGSETTPAALDWRSARELIESFGLDRRMAGALHDSLAQCETANEALIAALVRVEERAQRARTQLLAGFQMNSLGELQSAGPEADRWCAVRQERLDRLRVLLHAAGHADDNGDALVRYAATTKGR